MAKLKRRSIIRINTNQAVDATLEFVPSGRPYIHFNCREIGTFTQVSGFIDDKDIPKLKRFAESAK